MSRIDDLVERLTRTRALPPPRERKALRLQTGQSARSWAAACGVTVNAFIKWEDGTSTPRGDHLDSYGDLLDAVRRELAS